MEQQQLLTDKCLKPTNSKHPSQSVTLHRTVERVFQRNRHARWPDTILGKYNYMTLDVSQLKSDCMLVKFDTARNLHELNIYMSK